MKTYQKRDVILTLVEAGHVTIDDTHKSNEYGEFGEFVRDVLAVAFILPPTHLVLTDRTWTRMVHEGISGTGIVIGRVDTLNWQNAGRDIVSSPQTNAGRDARIHTGQVTMTDAGTDGIPVELLIEIVAALRLDARNLENSVERSKVRELANRIEAQADEEDPDVDTLEDSIARAERYVLRAGGLMTATYKALETWQQWRGQG